MIKILLKSQSTKFIYGQDKHTKLKVLTHDTYKKTYIFDFYLQLINKIFLLIFMEDIFKNFDENLEKMSSVLDERERADIIADNIFFHLNIVLKNSRDGNAYSKWNKLFSVPENAKRIQKSNLETLVTKSKELIDTYLITLLFLHMVS